MNKLKKQHDGREMIRNSSDWISMVSNYHQHRLAACPADQTAATVTIANAGRRKFAFSIRKPLVFGFICLVGWLHLGSSTTIELSLAVPAGSLEQQSSRSSHLVSPRLNSSNRLTGSTVREESRLQLSEVIH